MDGLYRRSRFVFGSSSWTTELSARPWTPVDNTIGGSRTSAAGIPASYIVRRDAMIELTLRVEEAEYTDLLALIAFGQTSQPFDWYPDVDDTVTVMHCYLEAPLAGERWSPSRMGEFLRVFEMTILLRQTATSVYNIWTPYFEPTPATVADRTIVFITSTPNTFSIPVGGAQEVVTLGLNEAVEPVPDTTVIYVPDDPTIVAVDPDTGLISGVSTGSTSVTPYVDAVAGPIIPITITAPPAGSTGYDNEPVGYTSLVDHSFGTIASWFNANSPWADVAVAIDAAAPKSPSDVIEWTYPSGGSAGPFPSRYFSLGGDKSAIYLCCWFRLSDPWDYHVSGVNKMFFIDTNQSSAQENEVVFTVHGTAATNAAIKVSIQNPGPDAYKGPNVNTTLWVPGAYHKLEAILIANTAGASDGQLDWWVDGTKQGAYTGLRYNASVAGKFKGVLWQHYWGGGADVKVTTDTIRDDHLYVSGIA